MILIALLIICITIMLKTSVIKPVSSNTSFESYSVQLSGNINNVQIVDENGNPITGTIEASRGFKVRVPVSELQKQYIYFTTNYCRILCKWL